MQIKMFNSIRNPMYSLLKPIAPTLIQTINRSISNIRQSVTIEVNRVLYQDHIMLKVVAREIVPPPGKSLYPVQKFKFWSMRKFSPKTSFVSGSHHV